MANRTVIAFDFGTRSIGIAIGQESQAIARPLTSLKVQANNLHWLRIEKILQEWQPELAIVGLPLNMDGTKHSISTQACKFANRLHGRFGIQVTLCDERLTTIEARSKLFNQGGYRALNKSKIDSISAFIILESWFEKNP